MHIGQTVAQRPRGVPPVQEQTQQLVAEQEDQHGDGQGEHHHHKEGGLQPLLHPLVLAGPDVLGGVAGHSVGEVHVGQHGQRVDFGGGSVPGHQHLAVGVHQPLHHHHGQGDQGLLEHGGQADPGDALHCQQVEQGDLLPLPPRLAGHAPQPPDEHQQGAHRAHPLGDEGGPGHAGHTHVELDHKDQVQRNVGQAGDHQKEQGGAAVPLGVVDAVEGVVEKQEYRPAEVDL